MAPVYAIASLATFIPASAVAIKRLRTAIQ
nr:MAG TPA: Protein of unknown function (DUF805) [Myoviridae sp. ct6nn14]